MKHVIILSTKSSGSTALQNYLKENLGFNTVDYTKHQEEETLYWTKVASVLGMEQESLYRSIVPIQPEKAVEELNKFFQKNQMAHIQCSLDTTEEEFQDYYFQLIQKYGPKFIEKSPHHLYNKTNLQLLQNFREKYNDKVEIVVLGLIRHPHAVLFSAWNRWKYLPAQFEEEWVQSYTNLLEWKEKLEIRYIRYEDMVTYKTDVPALVNERLEGEENYKFRSSSREKWKDSTGYGFVLSSKARKIAKLFGYKKLGNIQTMKWSFLKTKYSILHRAITFLRG